MPVTIRVHPHPLLELGAFVARLPRPLADIASPPVTEFRLRSSNTVKAGVRDLLRHGGFKPSGRSKPASEYLIAAHARIGSSDLASTGWPRINALVDTCNVVSLYAGLPISIVDLDKVAGDLAVRIAPAGTTYVFNPSGQVIDAGGLVCLYDELGPTGTPVKDAQRTKTDDATRTALAIVWGTHALAGRTAETLRWYRELMEPIATLEDVLLTGSA